MQDKQLVIILVQILGLFWGVSVNSTFTLDTAQKVKVGILTVFPTILWLVLLYHGEI